MKDPRPELDLFHALNCCGLSAARTARHDNLVTDVVSWLKRKKIQVKKEVDVAPPNRWRTDIWVRSEDGVVWWADLTVAEPSCPSDLKLGSDTKAGVAVDKADG